MTNAVGAKLISSSEQIVREIMQSVFEGGYVPGQKLTEVELSRRFGVGRGSVREALKRLAADGIVTESLHRGVSIRAPSRREARDILDVVELLVVLAARRGAERLYAEADIKTLQYLRKKFSSFRRAPSRLLFRRLCVQFYRLLARISQNQELIRLVNTVVVHLLQEPRLTLTPEGVRQQAHEISEIISALLAKDATRAELAMQQHVRRAAQLVDSLPDEAFAF